VTTEAPAKQVRDGNAAKRAAILEAARELYLHSGVERTSMDGVAARAGVSKRTVYDYFGDKRSLLLAVIEQATASLRAFVVEADERNFGEAAGIATVDDLERALIRFAQELGRGVIAAPDYIVGDRLARENAVILPELVADPPTSALRQLLVERLKRFADQGLIDAPDPVLAADHFKALTIHLAIGQDSPQPDGSVPPDPDRIDRIMTAGALAFIRAYRRRG
jgi:TetR/AcrR family transcriptional repressor of mexJK operon